MWMRVCAAIVVVSPKIRKRCSGWMNALRGFPKLLVPSPSHRANFFCYLCTENVNNAIITGAPKTLRLAPQPPSRWEAEMTAPLVAPAKKELPDLVELQNRALELGFVCFPLHKYRKQLGTMMARRMCQRRGEFIYQSAAFSLDNFPLSAAEHIFPDHLVTLTTTSVKTWKSSTFTELMQMTGTLLSTSEFACVGAARALKTESERVIRLIAQMLPDLEVSWVAEKDMERLYVNFMYVMGDHDGELYLPKTNQRVEIPMTDSAVQQVRQVLMEAVIKMEALDYPLAPGFLRQMGKEDEAMRVEAVLTNPYNPPSKAKKRKEGSDLYEIERILDERPSRGKAKSYALVRWSGYHPSWEAWRTEGNPGDPVETWEPLAAVRQTIAWEDWNSSVE